MKLISIVFVLVLASAAPCLAQQQGQTSDGCTPQFLSETRLIVAPGVMQGLLLKKVLPDAADMDPSKDFTIKVMVIIDETGAVKCAFGIEGGPELYERSARTAQQWKFKPYLLNGRPAAVKSAVYFHFSSGRVEGNFSAQ
jgi:hypothetical protein